MAAADQILTVSEMSGAEQALIDAGETVSSLMERAGRGAADYAGRVAAGRPVTVLCGPGNNGGDGYVVARVLADAGVPVTVVAPLAPRTEAARAACAAWGGAPVENADEDVRGAMLVDCLFGSGLTRPLDAPLAALLLRLAVRHDYRIAVDLPSGVASDSGAMLNDDLPDYQLTIALGAWKFAHWSMPAMARMGARRLVEIGIAPVEGAARLLARPALAAPPADAHKYSRGLLAVIGGAMPGAGVLAARAAMHSGAGYVKLFAEHKSPVTPDELVVNDAPLDQALGDERISALLVGPGLGKEAKARFDKAMEADLPIVCDADALPLLRPEMLAGRSSPLLVTPHAGELAALCENFGIAKAARLERVRSLAEVMRAVVIAKGPDTLIAAPGAPLRIAPPAPSWLSTAGTGDVLAGIIASRLASDAPPEKAAAEGVWLHGEAARRAGPAFTAGQLIDVIPEAYAACL